MKLRNMNPIIEEHETLKPLQNPEPKTLKTRQKNVENLKLRNMTENIET